MLLTRAQLAARWRVSLKTVERLVADGLPRAVRGGGGRPDRFDPDVADRWRATREAATQTPDVVSLEAARIRKELSIVRKNELEIRKREGEFVEVAEVVRVWAVDSVTIRQRLRAIPRALAPRLVAAAADGPPAVRRLLADAIDAALRKLAGDGKGGEV